MLARRYGIHPWDLERLRYGEAVRLLRDVEAYHEHHDPDSATNRLRKEHKAQREALADSLFGGRKKRGR